ncbi:hypothetical protein CIG75_17305 [Tumebacillus algifaecis]|uniref:Terpene synthase n=1 Tax=Tumebacillus algifaecis TaxID=1214604 RepID=A0A223D5A3_9BACL|nr:hypothetical protein [Tumebacillus algifaecis]ASS76544.1 hypothetical protein CIG75_17305 [Tumebacillus algifaecis]
MQNPFENPPRTTRQLPFTGIEFGGVREAPPIAQLRGELNQHLFALTADLPEPLCAEAHQVLRGYSGGDGDFYRLFYTPIWSFLHWVPEASGQAADAILLQEAQKAHAMSLFLYLWDDHLSDHLLPVDLLRLQVRTLAWQSFASRSRSLCKRIGTNPSLPDWHANSYLASLHRPRHVLNLEDYCQQFQQQVSIWTVVPYLLGSVVGGDESASALARLIMNFAVAWRLLDDVQDIEHDLLRGTESAVWIELDPSGKELWAACHSQPQSAEAWAELVQHIQGSGCLQRLLHLIDCNLQTASATAAAQGWFGIVQELEQCRQGIGIRPKR